MTAPVLPGVPRVIHDVLSWYGSPEASQAGLSAIAVWGNVSFMKNVLISAMIDATSRTMSAA